MLRASCTSTIRKLSSRLNQRLLFLFIPSRKGAEGFQSATNWTRIVVGFRKLVMHRAVPLERKQPRKKLNEDPGWALNIRNMDK